jgi:glycerophosphoryl diester phosphodiesterase
MAGQERFKEINSILNKELEEKKTLIAVHRGTWGGNIVENTIAAYTISRNMGADMFECDLSKSTDGVVYVNHDGGEKRLFGRDENIKTMSSEQIDQLICRNSIGLPSMCHVERFEQIVEHFCHGELYNVDRAWDILGDVDEIMKRYPYAIHQAVIKTPVKEEYLEFFQNCPRKYMYMPIAYNMDDVKKALSYKDVNMVGVEVIAASREDELFQEENIQWIKDQGLYIWVNVITLCGTGRNVLYGGLDDDTALLCGPDKAWGILMEKGMGILQTDWPAQMREYRKTKLGV